MKKTMFRIALALMAAAFVLPVVAEETGQINYQARLLDAYGRRLNTTVELSFKIYDAAADGALLWSETHADVVVQDGVYSVALGSLTPIPASVFENRSVYLELGINGETMTPRQQITASAEALVARTVMGSNIFENQASGDVGIGTMTPAAKLDVSGTIQAAGFKMPTGATDGYVLVSDAAGVGTWQSMSIVLDEKDPIHTNWVQVVFTPAMAGIAASTNDMWDGAAGIKARVLAATYSAATGALWAAVNQRVLIDDYAAATGALWTAANARVLRVGDIMTGPLTNEAGFFGNGAGLTNISSSGISLTGVVHRTGDTMTGALVISNNLTVALTNDAGETNYIALGGVAISNWNQVTGGDLTNELVQLQTATGVLNTSVGTLNNDVGSISNQVDLHIEQIGAISNDLDTAEGNITKLQADVVVVSNDLDTAEGNITKLQADVVVVSNDLDAAEGNITKLQADMVVVSNQADAAKGIADGLNARSNAWDNAVINRTGTAGDAIAAANVYCFAPDGSWSNASASVAATAQGMLGLALGTTVGEGMLLNGQYDGAWSFNPGDILYLSTTANQITATRPSGANEVVRIVGYAVDANTIYFNPDRTYIEVIGD